MNLFCPDPYACMLNGADASPRCEKNSPPSFREPVEVMTQKNVFEESGHRNWPLDEATERHSNFFAKTRHCLWYFTPLQC